MTTQYRDKLKLIREQDKVETNQDQSLVDSVTREDQLLGDIELVTDPNDLPSEIRKNLEANLGPIDTVAELEAKGLNKKNSSEDDELDTTHSFRP
jgi:hypothetical protein